MRELDRGRSDGQFWMTRGQLAALGVTTVSMAVLAFFVGMVVGQRRAPPPPTAPVHTGLVDADIENDAIIELLARVEAAADGVIGEANARELRYPERLVAEQPPVAMPNSIAPADPIIAIVQPEPIHARPAAADEEEPTADAPPASDASTLTGWAIQVGSYPSVEEADARMRALRSEVSELKVWRTGAIVKGSTWHRVRIGPYASKDAALAALPDLRTRLGSPDLLVTAAR